ncbi:uncharacterized protein LOC135350954 isoform X2 [Halichondria panicea]|uniref:uncharacterized protein LOC135350954 isoform X2 n=1 Tax=Halichondria panicea TaxID=6063 RepID=UPI00312BC8C1
MEEEIALLRREALCSISSKGSKYAMDEFFQRSDRKPAKSRRKLMPDMDVSRDVVGGFGFHPPKTGIRDKPQRRCRSGTSSPSRSTPSHSYTSYSSSSHSRSRSSSSSSSDCSSNNHSSSFSGSSRSTSPRNDTVALSRKGKRKTPHRRIPLLSDDRVLEYNHRKQPRYAEDVSPPPAVHHRVMRQDTQGHRRGSKNNVPIMDTLRSRGHVAHKSAPRICSNDKSHRARPSMDAPRSSSRHHPTHYHEPKFTHNSPSYHYHSPPAHSRLKRDRPPRRVVHCDEERYLYNKRGQVAPSPIPPKYRSKPLNHEKDHTSSFRQSKMRSQGTVLNVKSRRHSEKFRDNAEHSRQPKDRYIVVEDSTYPDEEKASVRTGPANKHRKQKEDSTKEIGKKLPDAGTVIEDSNPKHIEEDPDEESIEPTIGLDSEAVQAPGHSVLWKDDGFVEELDYNEEMDNLDIHPPEEVVDVGEESFANNKSHKSSEDVVENEQGHESDVSRVSSAGDDARPISSPLRVSPERSSGNDKWSSRGKIPVKQRLYLSKQKIEEKKRSARYQDRETPDLRPSLANRLGPPHRRDNSTLRRFDSPAKGSAMAIAEAYRKKKEEKNKSLHIRVNKDGNFMKSTKAEMSKLNAR